MSIIRDLSNLSAMWRKFVYAIRGKEERIMEVELWGWGENKGINTDEESAWALIKYLHRYILCNDDNWHFFYENWYNIIRCSESFYPEVIKELDAFGVYYREKGEWKDGSKIVRKYQDIYKDLFHNFSLLALKEYECKEINTIYDRMSHCFFNHQFYVLENLREKYGRQWEAILMNNAAMYRAEYTGMCVKEGVYPHKSNLFITEYETIPEQLAKRECLIAKAEREEE